MREITTHRTTVGPDPEHQVGVGIGEVIRLNAADEPNKKDKSSSKYEVLIRRYNLWERLRSDYIKFQDQPYNPTPDEGQPPDTGQPNGLTNEVLLAIVLDRLQCLQTSEFACNENEEALKHVNLALNYLHTRTRDRFARGVLGRRIK